MDDLARLAALRDRGLNYDPDGPHTEADGWRVDHYVQALPPEPPGEPVPGGSFEVARDLLRNYRVADPSMVRATYDGDAPLEGRDMLLELRFGPLRFHVGCRVGRVSDELRTADGRCARVWGWPYMTLEGHLEEGQMDWEVWKWLDTGEVEFRIRSLSRQARTLNPFLRLGFEVFGQRSRRRYLSAALRRMSSLTAEALRGSRPSAPRAA